MNGAILSLSPLNSSSRLNSSKREESPQEIYKNKIYDLAQFELTKLKLKDCQKISSKMAFKDIEIKVLNDLIGEERVFLELEQCDPSLKVSLLNTFKLASLHLPHLKTYVYEKETDYNLGYAITSGRQMYISADVIAKGSLKTVKEAVHVNKAIGVAKIVIRGSEDKILRALVDLQFNKFFYVANDIDIKRPTDFKELILTKAKSGLNKLVYFETRLRDGRYIQPDMLFHIANFVYGHANALSTVHEKGFVHCDGKIENVLFEGDLLSKVPIKSYLNDFDLCIPIGSLVKGTTPQNAPPEFIPYLYAEQSFDPKIQKENITVDYKQLSKKNIPANPSFDAYQLGISTLRLLFPNQMTNLNKKFGELSIEEKKAKISEFNDIVENEEGKHKDYKRLKQRLVSIADRLTEINSKERMTCRTAIKEIRFIIYSYCSSFPLESH